MEFKSYCVNGACKHVSTAHAHNGNNRIDAVLEVNEGNLSKLENEMATYFYEDFTLPHE